MKLKSKIITANAGSGKTYQIVERVKEIVNNGHCPSSILCITFTKIGQKEMEERLIDLPKNYKNKKPKIVTFHALCMEILSIMTKEIDIPMDFELMEYIQEDFLNDVFLDILATKNAQNYITKFKILPNDFRKVIKILIQNANTNADEKTRLQYLEEKFNIKFEKADETILQIQNDILQNIPIEMLQKLDGKTATENLPQILEMYENNTNFWKYASIITKILVKKEPFASYKRQIQEKCLDILNIVEFQKSCMLNKIYTDVPKILEKHKKLHKKYTFDDLINKTLQIFQNEELSSFALFTIAEKINHLIVDEAQDTNRKQWAILAPIIEEFKSRNMADSSVFIVGDPKQTIYGFQGSEENMMMEIHHKYPFLEQEFLQKSYRTTAPVLDIINSMAEYFNISDNSKHISAFEENTGFVQIITPINENDDNEFENISQKIVDTIQNLLTQNLTNPKYNGAKIQPKHIAILVKNRLNEKQSLAIKQCFYNAKVNITFNEKINIKNYRPILNFINLLKLCIIENDLENIYNTLKSPIFEKKEENFHHIFNNEADEKAIFENILEFYPDFSTTMQKYKQVLHSMGISNFFLYIFSKHYAKYSESEQKILQAFIKKTETSNQFAFINFIQAFENSDGILVNQEIAENSITLTTIHNSKGLEFPIVIFLDAQTKDKPNNDQILFTANKIPVVKHYFSLQDSIKKQSIINQILEETKNENLLDLPRLHYVAISRSAEQFFYICTKKNAESDLSFYRHIKNGMEKLNHTTKSDDIFQYMQYGNLIYKDEIQEIQMTSVNISDFNWHNNDNQSQSEEAKFGTFIHLLFENIDRKEKLTESMYINYLSEEVFFENILQKVQNFNKKINEKLMPDKILREHEFIFKNKIIRMDAIYFCKNEICIVDYKTQKKGTTDDIKNQLLEYKMAIEDFYKMPTKCFIAWFFEEDLEEIFL